MKKFNSDDFNIEEFEALWDNLIVRPISIESKGEWSRPQSAEDKREIGEVIHLGEDVKEFEINEGDIVLFNKYSSTEIDISEELVVRAEDVVAILKRAN